MPRAGWEDTHGREAVEEAVRTSTSHSEVLRKLGLRAAGGNHRTLRTYIERWSLDASHFDAYAAQRGAPGPRPPKPLAEVLVAGSDYSRSSLKRRLWAEGLKERRCELCGQGEEWRGRTMGLVLDHINGVHDDNRLENLRIVCPNCNATLETHCGRHNRVVRRCEACGEEFHPQGRQRYCSPRCYNATPRAVSHAQRRVVRPPEAQLRAEVAASSYSAVGRAYGVSDNAIRKWLRQYERERAGATPARDRPDTRRD